MLVNQSKSNVVFLVEDLIEARQLTVHAMCTVHYPVTLGFRESI